MVEVKREGGSLSDKPSIIIIIIKVNNFIFKANLITLQYQQSIEQ